MQKLGPSKTITGYDCAKAQEYVAEAVAVLNKEISAGIDPDGFWNDNFDALRDGDAVIVVRNYVFGKHAVSNVLFKTEDGATFSALIPTGSLSAE